MSDLDRAIINSVLPKGSIWRVEPDGDLDKMFDGIADNWGSIRLFLGDLAYFRDPASTSFLPDLEREFGILTNNDLTETERREQLRSIMFTRGSNGSVDALQIALDSAGFDVQVHENSPAVDPAIFLTQAFQMVAAGANAFAGRADAFAGSLGGELIVNGDMFKNQRLFTVSAGSGVYAGDGFTAGEYSEIFRTELIYQVPTNPDDWPLVFFVGGDATRNVSGELTAIEQAIVPIERRTAFRRIILKYKPIHSWGGLIVRYT